MSQPAAKLGDQVVATDMHLIQMPGAPPPPPVPTPHPFTGVIQGGCVASVLIQGQQAAVRGSTANNTPPHVPIPPTGMFVNPPTNMATILTGSATVLIGGQPAARAGDAAQTCTDMPPPVPGKVVAVSTVLIGG